MRGEEIKYGPVSFLAPQKCELCGIVENCGIRNYIHIRKPQWNGANIETNMSLSPPFEEIQTFFLSLFF